MSARPGGKLANRPLNFFWITDCSGSMNADGKMVQLNQAIKEAIPHMQEAARENPNARVLVRALRFASGASWCTPEPIPVTSFKWHDLHADGVTDLGHALQLLAEQLDIQHIGERALPPVIVLVSDGQPTDDWRTGFNEVLNKPWGKKSVRLAISIGRDADLQVLEEFSSPGIKPIASNTPQQLISNIKWASTVPITQVSNPRSTNTEGSVDANLMTPPPSTDNVPDVW